MKNGALSRSNRPLLDSRRRRRTRGFSLVTVAALGAVTMAWLFAIMQSVTPMFQRAAQNRYSSVMRSGCEAGIDYAVSSLVEAMTPGATASPFDDPTAGAPYHTTIMPADLVGTSGVNVTVEVRNESPFDSKTYLYDSITDPEAANNAVGGANYYRYVKATATYSGLTKTIAVILKPMHGAVNETSTPAPTPTPETTVTNTAVPYFQWAAFGRSLVSMSGNSYTDAYNSANGLYNTSTNRNFLEGTVGTNAQGSLSGNASVGGDLIVTSLPLGSTTSTVATGSSTTTIHDQLIINGQSSGLNGQTDLITPTLPTDNVRAESQTIPVASVIPVMNTQSNQPVTVPDAPSPPTGTVDNPVYNVGTMSISGNGNIVIQNGAPAPSGSINVTGNNTVYIPPGNYIINSLKTSGNGAISISSSISSPVRLFVQGSTSGADAISITGNGIVNGTNSPGMMQIWYDGAKGVKLSGNGALHAVVYAPKAPVTVNGNGALYGSVVGDTVSMSGNGGLHFDTALRNGSTNWGVNWTLTTTTTTNPEAGPPTVTYSTQVSGLKAVSWQEQ